jgi:hypothetical protein
LGIAAPRDPWNHAPVDPICSQRSVQPVDSLTLDGLCFLEAIPGIRPGRGGVNSKPPIRLDFLHTLVDLLAYFILFTSQPPLGDRLAIIIRGTWDQEAQKGSQ